MAVLRATIALHTTEKYMEDAPQRLLFALHLLLD